MIVRRREAGQNLVEFSLVMMFLLIVAFGVLDLGRAFFSIITISNAAREGARYLTRNPDAIDLAKSIAVEEANNSMVDIQTDDVDVATYTYIDLAAGCDSCTAVRVTVNYEFNPIMGWFIQGPIRLHRSVEMIVQ